MSRGRTERTRGSPTASAAAHQAADGCHPFVGELFRGSLGTAVDHAVSSVVVEQAERHLVAE